MIIAEKMSDITNEVAKGADTAVLFTAPSWCAPCRALAPHWTQLDGTVEETLVTVDLDTVPDAAVLYRVQAVPTIMLFVDGVFVKTIPARTVVALQNELTPKG